MKTTTTAVECDRCGLTIEGFIPLDRGDLPAQWRTVTARTRNLDMPSDLCRDCGLDFDRFIENEALVDPRRLKVTA